MDIATQTIDNAIRAVATQANQVIDTLEALEVYADPASWEFTGCDWIWMGPGAKPYDGAAQAIKNFRLWKEQKP